MVTFDGNDHRVRAPEVEIKATFQWAHLLPAPCRALFPSPAEGGGAADSACKAAAGSLADTAVLACLRVIDVHLSLGTGLASLAATRAELLALLDSPGTAQLLTSESWLRLGVLALLAEADVVQAVETAQKSLHLAVEGDEISLQLSCLALLGVADALAGRVVRADVRLSDAVFLCARRDATLLAQVVVRGAAGLVALMLGEPERADAELVTAAGLAGAAGLPGSVPVLLLGHRLYAAAALGREAESTDCARLLGEVCIPAGRCLLCAYRHLALGVLALRSGQALRALERADACIEQAGAGGVGLLSALGTLLRVQALADPARVKIVAT